MRGWIAVIFCLLLCVGDARANLKEGLRVWLKMEEATGVNWVDSTGNGYTGTVVSSPTSTGNCPREGNP